MDMRALAREEGVDDRVDDSAAKSNKEKRNLIRETLAERIIAKRREKAAGAKGEPGKRGEKAEKGSAREKAPSVAATQEKPTPSARVANVKGGKRKNTLNVGSTDKGEVFASSSEIWGPAPKGRTATTGMPGERSLSLKKEGGRYRVMVGTRETDRVYVPNDTGEGGRFETDTTSPNIRFKSESLFGATDTKVDAPDVGVRSTFIGTDTGLSGTADEDMRNKRASALSQGGEQELNTLSSRAKVNFDPSIKGDVEVNPEDASVTINPNLREGDTEGSVFRQKTLKKAVAYQASQQSNASTENITEAINDGLASEKELNGVSDAMESLAGNPDAQAKLLVAEALIGNDKAIKILTKLFESSGNEQAKSDVRNVIEDIEDAAQEQGPNSDIKHDIQSIANRLRVIAKREGFDLGAPTTMGDVVFEEQKGVFEVEENEFEQIKKTRSKKEEAEGIAMLDSGGTDAEGPRLGNNYQAGSIIEVRGERENETGETVETVEYWMVTSTHRRLDGSQRHEIKKITEEQGRLQDEINRIFTGPEDVSSMVALVNLVRNLKTGTISEEVRAEIRSQIRQAVVARAGVDYADAKLEFVTDEDFKDADGVGRMINKDAKITFVRNADGSFETKIIFNEDTLFKRVKRIADRTPPGKNHVSERALAEDLSAMLQQIAFEEVAHDHALQHFGTPEGEGELMGASDEWYEAALEDSVVRQSYLKWYRYTTGRLDLAADPDEKLWEEIQSKEDSDDSKTKEAWNQQKLQMMHEALAGFVSLVKTGNTSLSAQGMMNRWFSNFVGGTTLAGETTMEDQASRNKTRTFLLRMSEMASRMIESIQRFMAAHRELRALPPEVDRLVKELEGVLEEGGIKPPDHFNIQKRALEQAQDRLAQTVNAANDEFSLWQEQKHLRNLLDEAKDVLGVETSDIIQISYEPTEDVARLVITEAAEQGLTVFEYSRLKDALKVINNSNRPSVIARNAADAQEIQFVLSRMGVDGVLKMDSADPDVDVDRPATAEGEPLLDPVPNGRLVGTTPEEKSAIISNLRREALLTLSKTMGLKPEEIVTVLQEHWHSHVSTERNRRYKELQRKLRADREVGEGEINYAEINDKALKDPNYTGTRAAQLFANKRTLENRANRDWDKANQKYKTRIERAKNIALYAVGKNPTPEHLLKVQKRVEEKEAKIQEVENELKEARDKYDEAYSRIQQLETVLQEAALGKSVSEMMAFSALHEARSRFAAQEAVIKDRIKSAQNEGNTEWEKTLNETLNHERELLKSAEDDAANIATIVTEEKFDSVSELEEVLSELPDSQFASDVARVKERQDLFIHQLKLIEEAYPQATFNTFDQALDLYEQAPEAFEGALLELADGLKGGGGRVPAPPFVKTGDDREIGSMPDTGRAGIPPGGIGPILPEGPEGLPRPLQRFQVQESRRAKFDGMTREEIAGVLSNTMRSNHRLLDIVKRLQTLDEEMDYALLGGRVPDRIKRIREKGMKEDWHLVNLQRPGDLGSVPLYFAKSLRNAHKSAIVGGELGRTEPYKVSAARSELETILKTARNLDVSWDSEGNVTGKDAKEYAKVTEPLRNKEFLDVLSQEGIYVQFTDRNGFKFGVRFEEGLPIDIQGPSWADKDADLLRSEWAGKLADALLDGEIAAYSLLGYDPTMFRDSRPDAALVKAVIFDASISRGREIALDTIRAVYRGDTNERGLVFTGGYSFYRKERALAQDAKGEVTLSHEYLEAPAELFALPKDWPERPMKDGEIDFNGELETYIEDGILAETLLAIGSQLDVMENGSDNQDAAILHHRSGLTPAGLSYQMVATPFTSFLYKLKNTLVQFQGKTMTAQEALALSVYDKNDESKSHRIEAMFKGLYDDLGKADRSISGSDSLDSWNPSKSNDALINLRNSFVDLYRAAGGANNVFNTALSEMRNNYLRNAISHESGRASLTAIDELGMQRFPIDIRLGEKMAGRAMVFQEERRRSLLGPNAKKVNASSIISVIAPNRASELLEFYHRYNPVSERLVVKNGVVMGERAEAQETRGGVGLEVFGDREIENELQREQNEANRLAKVRTIALLEIHGYDLDRVIKHINDPKYATRVYRDGQLETDYHLELLDADLQAQLERMAEEEEGRRVVALTPAQRIEDLDRDIGEVEADTGEITSLEAAKDLKMSDYGDFGDREFKPEALSDVLNTLAQKLRAEDVTEQVIDGSELGAGEVYIPPNLLALYNLMASPTRNERKIEQHLDRAVGHYLELKSKELQESEEASAEKLRRGNREVENKTKVRGQTLGSVDVRLRELSQEYGYDASHKKIKAFYPEKTINNTGLAINAVLRSKGSVHFGWRADDLLVESVDGLVPAHDQDQWSLLTQLASRIPGLRVVRGEVHHDNAGEVPSLAFIPSPQEPTIVIPFRYSSLIQSEDIHRVIKETMVYMSRHGGVDLKSMATSLLNIVEGIDDGTLERKVKKHVTEDVMKNALKPKSEGGLGILDGGDPDNAATAEEEAEFQKRKEEVIGNAQRNAQVFAEATWRRLRAAIRNEFEDSKTPAKEKPGGGSRKGRGKISPIARLNDNTPLYANPQSAKEQLEHLDNPESAADVLATFFTSNSLKRLLIFSSVGHESKSAPFNSNARATLGTIMPSDIPIIDEVYQLPPWTQEFLDNRLSDEALEDPENREVLVKELLEGMGETYEAWARGKEGEDVGFDEFLADEEVASILGYHGTLANGFDSAERLLLTIADRLDPEFEVRPTGLTAVPIEPGLTEMEARQLMALVGDKELAKWFPEWEFYQDLATDPTLSAAELVALDGQRAQVIIDKFSDYTRFYENQELASGVVRFGSRTGLDFFSGQEPEKGHYERRQRVRGKWSIASRWARLENKDKESKKDENEEDAHVIDVTGVMDNEEDMRSRLKALLLPLEGTLPGMEKEGVEEGERPTEDIVDVAYRKVQQARQLLRTRKKELSDRAKKLASDLENAERSLEAIRDSRSKFQKAKDAREFYDSLEGSPVMDVWGKPITYEDEEGKIVRTITPQREMGEEILKAFFGEADEAVSRIAKILVNANRSYEASGQMIPVPGEEAPIIRQPDLVLERRFMKRDEDGNVIPLDPEAEEAAGEADTSYTEYELDSEIIRIRRTSEGGLSYMIPMRALIDLEDGAVYRNRVRNVQDQLDLVFSDDGFKSVKSLSLGVEANLREIERLENLAKQEDGMLYRGLNPDEEAQLRALKTSVIRTVEKTARVVEQTNKVVEANFGKGILGKVRAMPGSKVPVITAKGAAYKETEGVSQTDLIFNLLRPELVKNRGRDSNWTKSLNSFFRSINDLKNPELLLKKIQRRALNRALDELDGEVSEFADLTGMPLMTSGERNSLNALTERFATQRAKMEGVNLGEVQVRPGMRPLESVEVVRASIDRVELRGKQDGRIVEATVPYTNLPKEIRDRFGYYKIPERQRLNDPDPVVTLPQLAGGRNGMAVMLMKAEAAGRKAEARGEDGYSAAVDYVKDEIAKNIGFVPDRATGRLEQAYAAQVREAEIELQRLNAELEQVAEAENWEESQAPQATSSKITAYTADGPNTIELKGSADDIAVTQEVLNIYAKMHGDLVWEKYRKSDNPSAFQRFEEANAFADNAIIQREQMRQAIQEATGIPYNIRVAEIRKGQKGSITHELLVPNDIEERIEASFLARNKRRPVPDETKAILQEFELFSATGLMPDRREFLGLSKKGFGNFDAAAEKASDPDAWEKRAREDRESQAGHDAIAEKVFENATNTTGPTGEKILNYSDPTEEERKVAGEMLNDGGNLIQTIKRLHIQMYSFVSRFNEFMNMADEDLMGLDPEVKQSVLDLRVRLRKFIRRTGGDVNLSGIKGSGKDGEVTKEDVDKELKDSYKPVRLDPRVLMQLLSLYQDSKGFLMALRHDETLEHGFLNNGVLENKKAMWNGLMHHDSRIKTMFAKKLEGQMAAQSVGHLLEYGPTVDEDTIFGRSGARSQQESLAGGLAESGKNLSTEERAKAYLFTSFRSYLYSGKREDVSTKAQELLSMIQVADSSLDTINEKRKIEYNSVKDLVGVPFKFLKERFAERDHRLLRDQGIYKLISTPKSEGGWGVKQALEKAAASPDLGTEPGGAIDELNSLLGDLKEGGEDKKGNKIKGEKEYANDLVGIFGYMQKAYQAQGQLIPKSEYPWTDDAKGKNNTWVEGNQHLLKKPTVPIKWQRAYLTKQRTEAGEEPPTFSDLVSMRGASWLKNPDIAYSETQVQLLDVNGLRAPTQMLQDMAYRLNVAPSLAVVQGFTGENDMTPGAGVDLQLDYVKSRRGALGTYYKNNSEPGTGEDRDKDSIENRMSDIGLSLGYLAQEQVGRDLERYEPTSRITDFTEFVGSWGMGSALISLRQWWAQSVFGLSSYAMFHGGLGKNTSVMPIFARYLQGTLENSWLYDKYEKLRYRNNPDARPMSKAGQFTASVQEFMKRKAFLVFMRNAEGIEMYRDLMQDSVPSLANTSADIFEEGTKLHGFQKKVLNPVGRAASVAGGKMRKGVRWGLGKTIAAAEKVTIQSIYMNEIMKRLSDSLDAHPAYDPTAGDTPALTLDNVLAGKFDKYLTSDIVGGAAIAARDILGQSDTSTKAEIFQRTQTMSREVKRGMFATFANHLLSTAANSHAGLQMMKHGADDETRRTGRRLLVTNVSQNVAYQLVNYQVVTALAGAVVDMFGDQDDEEAVEEFLYGGQGKNFSEKNLFEHFMWLISRTLGGSSRPLGWDNSKNNWSQERKRKDLWNIYGIRAAGELIPQLGGSLMWSATTAGGSVRDYALRRIASAVDPNLDMGGFHPKRAGLTLGPEQKSGERTKNPLYKFLYHFTTELSYILGDASYLTMGADSMAQPFYHWSNAGDKSDATIFDGLGLVAGAVPFIPREWRSELYRNWDDKADAKIWASQYQQRKGRPGKKGSGFDRGAPRGRGTGFGRTGF